MKETMLWPLLARYLANEATPDERQSVENWLADSETNRLTLERLRQRYKDSGVPGGLPDSDPAAVWNRHIAPHLSESENVRLLHRERAAWWQQTHWRTVGFRVAAALILLIGIYRFLWPALTEPALTVQANPVGKRSLITLSDGSRVWLNADSRLEFPKKFDGPLREVKLVGEAFFDVTHNPRQPFVIRLATASIRVLGTSFNVRAYPGERTVKTTVVTGRVAFVPNQSAASVGVRTADTLFVTPNRHVVQQVATMKMAEEPVVAQKEAAWKDNRLVFDQTPLAEVAQTLERWYGVRVTLERPDLASCPLTATFDGQSLPEVMDLMSRTGRFQYSLTDAGLTIRGQGCQESSSN